MMYMSGSGVQVFSLMSSWMLVKGAISAMLAVNTSASVCYIEMQVGMRVRATLISRYVHVRRPC